MRRCDGRRGSIARARRLTLRPLAMQVGHEHCQAQGGPLMGKIIVTLRAHLQEVDIARFLH